MNQYSTLFKIETDIKESRMKKSYLWTKNEELLSVDIWSQ